MSLLIFSPQAQTENFHDLYTNCDFKMAEPAGYPLLGQEACERKYLCSKCELLLRDPVQNIDCGHRFCLICYQLMVQNGNLKCPGCSKEGNDLLEKNKDNLGQCFRDNAIKREVLNLKRSCLNKGCDWKGPLKEFEEKHRHNCSSEMINCPYMSLGCNEQFRRKSLEEHEETRLVLHQRLLHQHLQQQALNSSTMLSDSVQSTIKDLKERLGHLESVRAEDKLKSGTPSTSTTTVEQRLAEVETKQKTLQNIITVLSHEMGRHEPSSCNENQLSPSAEARIAILEDKVRQQDSLLVLKDMMIQGLATHIQALQQATYDGTFLWKIDDVQRKIKEARVGKRPALYSPAFFAGRYGYKVCLKLFLNGDGAGHRSHLSLFLVIMKGDYDFQLAWPFLHKVIFLLMDQANQQHISASFRPSTSSSSFQLPTSPMNVASGVPEFIPLDILRTDGNRYIRDDTMVIKAVIDMNS